MNSMEKDTYGSTIRQHMKVSMKHPAKDPFRALNRRRYDRSDRVYLLGSWIVGSLAVLFIIATIAAQVLKVG